MLIAHQLGARHDRLLRDRLAAGNTLVALPEDDPWAMPRETEALLAGMRMVKTLPKDDAPPPGWPTGLRWVHLPSTGIDMLPPFMLRTPLVTVSRGAQAVAIAEYILAAMLAFEKDIPEIYISAPQAWKVRPLGGLAGRTLGLVGFGHIGREVAARALAFGMKVQASRRRAAPSGMADVAIVPLRTLCETSDHIVVAAPLTAATRAVLGPAEFAAMGQGVHLVNVSRGEMLDHESFCRALDDGTLARATLDVWNTEPPPANHFVYTHPRVRISPHISFSGPTTERTTDAILLENFAAWQRGDTAALHGAIDRAEGY
ncbi:MAG: D-isomer specific 2-hydroxyacid dehydrogenase family protein [Acuticoccus sp.]